MSREILHGDAKRMTSKEFLEQYRDSVYEVRRITGEINELRERALSFGSAWRGETYLLEVKDKETGAKRKVPAFEPMSGGGNGRNTSMEAVDAYIDKEFDRLRKAKVNALVNRRVVVDAIEAVDDARYRELLSHRYVGLYTWEWIAETMHADRATIWRWHGAALLKIWIPLS